MVTVCTQCLLFIMKMMRKTTFLGLLKINAFYIDYMITFSLVVNDEEHYLFLYDLVKCSQPILILKSTISKQHFSLMHLHFQLHFFRSKFKLCYKTTELNITLRQQHLTHRVKHITFCLIQLRTHLIKHTYKHI